MEFEFTEKICTRVLHRIRMKQQVAKGKDVLLHRCAASSQRLVLASFGQRLSCRKQSES